MAFYRRHAKRWIDVAVAGVAAIILSPLLLILALLVRVKLGDPILFRQERTGLGRRPFHILKFRSMLDAQDAQGRPLPDEHRLTAFGHFLRDWSLDELPSLWNIIRGDMSIVGPRPLMHHYDPLYSDEQARRFETRPGVTGWAQVNGRNAISWPEKFALDVWYVERESAWLDIRIVAMSVGRVFSRHGINNAEAATMPLFKGETLADEKDARTD